MSGRGLVLALTAAAALASCAVAVPPTGSTATPTPTAAPTPAATDLPPDVARLGSLGIATPAQAVGAISEAAAIAIAQQEGYAFPDPAAYLVVTRPEYPRGGRLIWIVRWTGLSFDGPIPAPRPPATLVAPSPFRSLYVEIDAKTGDFVLAEGTD